MDVQPGPADVGSFLGWIKDYAGPIIAGMALLFATSKGMFTWTWRGGASLGQLQTVQEQHTRDIAALREIVDELRADRKEVATKDDIRQLSEQVADIDRKSVV